ncbi:MAG: hypothetical protein HY287_12820 [Planctomycetes bacterium]|nr:hypothetical protein [Planctomycetota bacterium]
MTPRIRIAGWAWICTSVWILGCNSHQPAHAVRNDRPRNEALRRATIAVAPAVNVSGSTDFDPNRFADLMASELGEFDGISVIPVSRVLGVLAAQGLDRVESTAHAGELARWLGADAILVFAVTRYDAYEPPSIGISAQLYGARNRAGGEPQSVAIGRRHSEDGRMATAEQDAGKQQSTELLAQTQRMFDASHDDLVAEVRNFAASRTMDNSPYGWRKFMVSQRGFIQFCCYETIRDLIANRSAVAATK